MKQLLIGLLVGAGLVHAITPQSAAADCGVIETEHSGAQIITDCDNPFNLTQDSFPADFAFIVASTVVTNEMTEVMIPGESTTDIAYTLSSSRFPYVLQVFTETPEGYQELAPEEFEPTFEDLLVLLNAYFVDDPDVLLYQEALITNDTDNLTEDQEDTFRDFLRSEVWPLYGAEPQLRLPLGTYTFIFFEEQLCVSYGEPTWRENLRDFFIKTAHAQVGCGSSYVPERFAITLTLMQTPEEPTCHEIFYGDGTRVIIEDCDNPFGVSDSSNLSQKTVAGQKLSNSSEVTITALNTSDYQLSTTPISEQLLFEFVDGNYIERTSPMDGLVPAINAGAYTFVERAIIPGLTLPESIQAAFPFIVRVVPPEDAFSNILFLPGIQASRLYTTEPDGSEKLLWEPDFIFDDDDVLRLAMGEDGDSIESVYVKDVIDYAPQEPTEENAVYGGFLRYMENLRFNQNIAAYDAFAYDWRYDVYDVVTDGVQYKDGVKDLVQTLEQLAESSHTGKVAIVAHSNGGLLGKALIETLEAQGKTDLVDQFIMIGTPQLGTPKAIGSLLHGTDQGFSFDLFGAITTPVITDKAVREAAKNMPGAYGLLPGEAYIETAGDIIVLFDTSDATAVWRDVYGNTLNTQSELDDFLLSTANGRSDVPYDEMNEAIVVNEIILNQARASRARLDAWSPSDTIEVHSIVGIGRNTISGFHYSEFDERNCDEPDNGCVVYKPVPIMSQRGDQTVMVASAATTDSNIVNHFVDINRIEDVIFKKYYHHNFTEAASVQSLLTNILSGTSSVIDFISATAPEYDDQQLLFGTHSPVYLYVMDALGRRTGQLDADTVVEEIPEVEWFFHADSSYIIAPKELSLTIHIVGYDDGPATFTSHQFDQTGQTLISRVPIQVVTSSTTVTITYDTETLSPLAVDENGDGNTNYTITQDGTVVPNTYSYDGLIAIIEEVVGDTKLAALPVGLTRLAYQFNQRPPSRYFTVIEQRLLQKLLFILEQYHAGSIINNTDLTQLEFYVSKL